MYKPLQTLLFCANKKKIELIASLCVNLIFNRVQDTTEVWNDAQRTPL